MIAVVVAFAILTQAAPPELAWTWTLYADAEPIVLANEVTDTPNLRATLECDPGSSVARVTLYGGAIAGGMARVAAGDASSMTEAEAGREGSLKLALRADHPVFAAFATDGRMSVTVAGQRRMVEISRPHLTKLRRFAELCSG